MNPDIAFALPDIGEAEIREVVDCLRSGWITTGPRTARFESDFARFLGGEVDVVAVGSATAGLHLSLEAIGLQPGDEVIVPVHTFTATAEVVRYLGADPVFVDIDPHALTIDPAAAGAVVGPRTKAVMPVHYGGLAAAMQPLLDLAGRHGLAIIEDAAHALPTTYQRRLIGTLDTTATVFSFYATKSIATGEGGMIATRSPEIARRARIMRLHGIDRDVFGRYQGGGSWYYEVVAPGFKYNLTDMAAALGIRQLERVIEMRDRRASIAAAYNAAFRDLPLDLPLEALAGDLHAWHLYPVRVRPEAPIGRDALIAGLRKLGIGTSVHYVPLHFQPYWRDRYHLSPCGFPVSTDCYRRQVSLPIYSKMTDAAVLRVIDAVRGLLIDRQATDAASYPRVPPPPDPAAAGRAVHRVPQRTLDIAVAAIALGLASPVLAAAAIAIALSSPGPVLYWALRVGRGGRVFRMCKLRTMHVGPDRGPEITAPDDRRVFPVGGVLRATKLDEVPQLWNVLRGDMALVGPRPEDPAIVAQHYGPLERSTLAVPPGLTSPGALYGYTHGDVLLNPADPTGSYVTRLMPTKLRLEAVYVRDRSFAYDLRILARTVVIVTQRVLGRRRFPDPRELAHIDRFDAEPAA